MLAKVLKAFPYSEDGVTIQELAAGDVVNIADELAGGLTQEKWIEAAKPGATPTAGSGQGSSGGSADVAIPADWKSLPWAKFQALARKLSGEKSPGKDRTTQIIEAALKARA